MKSILAIFVMASLAAYGQKIETQKADRTKITRLSTTLNHLSVIEFNEPVKEVAVGSSNFKVEWRENKVFVQPLEPDAATNLFIWTASGRQSYELVPAESVNDMHFAIDEDPVEAQAKRANVEAPPSPPEPPKVPAAMLMESTGEGDRHRQKPAKSRSHSGGHLPEGWAGLHPLCNRERRQPDLFAGDARRIRVAIAARGPVPCRAGQ